jgi:hypothetical protein
MKSFSTLVVGLGLMLGLGIGVPVSGQNIDRAEYFFNADPGIGNGTSLSLSPGSQVSLNAEIDALGLSKGFNRLYLRFGNSQGQWGFYEARLFYMEEIPNSSGPNRTIIGAEYFIDQDPGIGQGTPLNVETGGKIIAEISEPNLPKGFHRLYIRYRDSAHKWGLYEARLFYMDEIPPVSGINRTIIGAEYFIDQDPGIGQGTPLNVDPDGKIIAEIPEPNLSKGFHRLYVRYRDNADKWGLYEARLFYMDEIPPVSGINRTIIGAEYFFDQDPGIGQGTPLTVQPDGKILAEIPEPNLSKGFHRLYVRYRDNADKWGLYEARLFYMDEIPPVSGINRTIIGAEYFIDQDPGIGQGTPLTVQPDGKILAEIPEPNLSKGFHRLYVRYRDNAGKWGLYEARLFYMDEVPPASGPDRTIVGAEYFFDQDPGVGNGNPLPVLSGGRVIAEIDMVDFPLGFHRMYIRYQDDKGDWGLYENRLFYIDNKVSPAGLILVDRVEYFFDGNDPGLGNAKEVPFKVNTLLRLDDLIATSGLASGDHTLHLRIRNTQGNWSDIEVREFTIEPSDDADPPMPDLEELPDISALCAVTVDDLIVPTATDAVDGSIQGTTGLGIFPIRVAGTTVITWTFTNSSGISSTQVQNIIITDNVPPLLIAPDDIVVGTGENSCTVTLPNLGNPEVSDNCSVASLTNNAPLVFQLGETLVVWTATDAAGNVSTAMQLVIVEDMIAPTITAPTNVTVTLPTGSTEATNVNLGSPAVSDNCTVDSVINDAPGTFPIGTTTVTWTVFDSFNNTASATQQVTIIAQDLPIITAPADISVNAEQGECSASDIELGMPIFTGDASAEGISNDAPAVFPVGNTLVTWTLTDNNGITVQDTQWVTVVDNQAPSIIAPEDIFIELPQSSPDQVEVFLGSPITSDNCTVALITNNAPSSFPIGTTTVTWTVTDQSGNSSTDMQLVVISFEDMLVLVAPEDVSVNTDSDSCVATGVNLGLPTSNKEILEGQLTNNAPSSYPLGTTVVTWTLTDINGNTATATQSVIVTDNISPVIVAPSAVTVNTDASICTASAVALGTPEASDNCSVASVSNNAPAVFAIGETLVTWTVTDGSGNVATATQLVTVVDNELPTIEAPATVTINTDSGLCTASGVVLGTTVTSDNCSVASVSNNAPAVFAIGETLVTWTVTDGSGNVATATQLVTVLDNELPTIEAPATVTVNTDAGLCTASGVVLGTTVTSDNCSVASVSNNAPAVFAIGETLVTWTVTDGSGNVATATQLVTVLDNELPTIEPPATVTINTDSGLCTASGVVLGTTVTSDNCSVASVSNNAPAVFAIGETSVTWTVTDGSGNVATATQLVTVLDQELPIIIAPNKVLLNLPVDSTEATEVILGTPQVSDNCSVASVTNDAPESFPIGTTMVTWTVVDASGNSASAIQLVEVNVSEQPVDCDSGEKWTEYFISGANDWRAITYGNGKFVGVSLSGNNRVMNSADGVNWTFHQAAEETNQWSAVTFGNGKFVAVANAANGNNNYVMSSTDGENWSAHEVLDIFNGFNSVAYGNGRFVAISNIAYSSTDGINWSRIQLPPTEFFNPYYSITYGNGRFVAVSPDVVITSTDGLNWQAYQTPESNSWESVTFGNGKFVAVAKFGSANRVMVSTDGANWNVYQVPESNAWWAVTFGNGRFVAIANGANRVMNSTDGINWTIHEVPSASSWWSIAYGDGKFVAGAIDVFGGSKVMVSECTPLPSVPAAPSNLIAAVADGLADISYTQGDDGGSPILNYEYSLDGGDWTLFESSPLMLKGLVNGQEYSITIRAVNAIGSGEASETITFSPTEDCFAGEYWIPVNAPGDAQWRSLAYGNGRFVAVAQSGQHRLMSSSDGFNWTIHSVPDYSWNAVAYGGGKFVVLGNFSNQVLVSEDGINWTNHTLPESNNAWTSITYGNGRFVAVATCCSTNRVMSSTDGINWTAYPATSENSWISVTYGNGRFVAVAQGIVGSQVMSSIDGLSWTAQEAVSLSVWSAISFGNGKFVAISTFSNQGMTSEDGMSWEPFTFPEENGWTSLSYGLGRFVAVANFGDNRVMTSRDGITWTLSKSIEQSGWIYIAYGAGNFVAISADGTNRVMVSTCQGSPDEIVPDVAVLPDVTGQCLVSFEQLTIPTAKDILGESILGVTDQSIFPITAQGTTVITWTYTDQEGNSATQTQRIVLEDTEAPFALTKDLVFEIEESETLTITAESIDAGSFDACGPVSLSIDKSVFSADDEGDNIVILTVTDAVGNISTEEAIVTIIVNITPVCKVVALANDLTVALDRNGVASITTRQANNGSFSECTGGTLTITLSQTSFTCANLGTNEVTLTATDRDGNIGTTVFTVTVVDNLAPTIAKTPRSIKVSIAPNTGYTLPDFRLQYPASDNCTVVSYLQSPLPGTVYTAAGVYPVTLTATDQSGNQTTATFNIELSVTQPRGGGRNNAIDMGTVMSLPWNTPFSEIEDMEVLLSDEAGEEKSYRVIWNEEDYDPLTPGLYQIRGTAMENISFNLRLREEEPLMYVFVEDKPMATGIELDSNIIPRNIAKGQVIGRLSTIDPVDDIHSYSLDFYPAISLVGNEILWNREEKPEAVLNITVHSTDRAGQTISREIKLQRELAPNDVLVYPNPAIHQSNILVELAQASDVTIRIFDGAGRLVMEEQGYHQESFVHSLDLKGLSSGIYHVLVQINHQVISRRLVKE